MIFFFYDYIDLSFDNSHNELQLDELPSNDDDKLLKQIQTIQAAYRNGIDQNIEDLMVNRAFARDSEYQLQRAGDGCVPLQRVSISGRIC